jgi:hypothetical protein
MEKARGVLPTYVTDREVFLCKIAPRLINAYEVRLALFMAVQRKLTFVLAVTPACEVAPDLLGHLARYGGTCRRGKIEEFSVYFGATDGSGAEVDGWVLGGREAWEVFRASLASERLQEAFVPGAWIRGSELQEVLSELRRERSAGCNVDDEPLIEAIVALAQTAARTGGALFAQ